MTKQELIEAMADFPGDMEDRIDVSDYDQKITKVEEICPTVIDTSENFLLLS